MNEEVIEQQELIPAEEKPELIPPFEIGDLVQMRSRDLKIGKFRKMPKNDLGIVVALKEPRFPFKGAKWLVEVCWQKFIPKSKSLIYHVRLKKVKSKKGKNKQHATQKD